MLADFVEEDAGFLVADVAGGVVHHHPLRRRSSSTMVTRLQRKTQSFCGSSLRPIAAASSGARPG